MEKLVGEVYFAHVTNHSVLSTPIGPAPTDLSKQLSLPLEPWDRPPMAALATKHACCFSWSVGRRDIDTYYTSMSKKMTLHSRYKEQPSDQICQFPLLQAVPRVIPVEFCLSRIKKNYSRKKKVQNVIKN